MIELNYSDKKAKVFTEFSEINLRTLTEGLEVFEMQPKSVKDFFLKGDDGVKEIDLFSFVVEWLEVFSTLTKQELRRVDLEPNANHVGSISLLGLMSETKKFIHPPETVADCERFVLNKVTYRLIEPLRTIGGAELFFGNATFEQLKLSAMLNDAMNEGVGKLRVDSLRQLVALLFSDGNDENEDIEKRIELFNDLDCETAFSAWFFFVLLTNKYKTFFQSYSNSQAAKSKIKEETWKRQLASVFTGKSSKMKLQKWEFLILTDEAQRNLYKKQKHLKYLNT